MEKWSKYFLSYLTLAFISCLGQENMNPDNGYKVADSLFNLDKKLYQGSKESQFVLKKAIEADSTYDDALREIAVPYLKRGMPHEWLPKFNKAVEQDPQTWMPYRGQHYLLFYRDYKKAIADFNASDTLTPQIDYPQGHGVDYWRGIAYLGLKDYENSIAYFDMHINKETEETGEDWVELEAFLYLGIAHYKKEEFQKAMCNFEKIEKYFAHSEEAKYYWAKCMLSLDKKEKAIALLDEAESDFKNKLRLHHNYVEMPYQIYMSDIEDLKSTLLQ